MGIWGWPSVADRGADPEQVTVAVKDGFVGPQLGAVLRRSSVSYADELRPLDEVDPEG